MTFRRSPVPSVVPYDSGNRPVRPHEGPYHNGDQELALLDAWAQEQVRHSGTRVALYTLDHGRSEFHPVHAEALDRRHRGPFWMWGWAEYPEGSPVVTDAGVSIRWPSKFWLPRASLEAVKAPPPMEGDIIRFWDKPFFTHGSDSDFEPEGGYFFLITKVNEDGHPFDDPGFVGFSLEGARDTAFNPERRRDEVMR